MGQPPDVTRLLLAWRDGDEAARDELMARVFDELRRIAARQLAREPAGHLLQPTALVNEAYLRLVDQQRIRWQNRAHFFAIAALLMRRLLVDYAREQRAAKRGGGRTLLPLNEEIAVAAAREVDVLALDQALTQLAAIDPRQARIVELRFFVGLKNSEIAEVLSIGEATVGREWALARAWLRGALAEAEAAG
jgi:RNA polymerase sigma factor (TIGR02999 family)